MGKGPVCVGGSREHVRHSSEHGLGSRFEDEAEGEALKVGEPRSSSHFNSYVVFLLRAEELLRTKCSLLSC